MTEIDRDAIRARQQAYRDSHDHPGAFACCSAHASADDVPTLLAEIDPTEAELAQTKEAARRLGQAFVLNVETIREALRTGLTNPRRALADLTEFLAPVDDALTDEEHELFAAAYSDEVTR